VAGGLFGFWLGGLELLNLAISCRYGCESRCLSTWLSPPVADDVAVALTHLTRSMARGKHPAIVVVAAFVSLHVLPLFPPRLSRRKGHRHKQRIQGVDHALDAGLQVVHAVLGFGREELERVVQRWHNNKERSMMTMIRTIR
jgi:hypothetical protein